MKDVPSILHDIRTVRDIETSLEEAEDFIARVKSNKVRLTMTDGAINISREEMAKITDLVVTLERSGKALETAVSYLRELMAYDEVTQMFSRRYILHLVEKELYRALRYDTHFSVIAFELDPFGEDLQHVNMGDMNMLVGEAARAIRHFIRDSDSPGRTSEKTFMVLCPETDVEGAKILAERIRNSVDRDYELSVGRTHMTMSGCVVDSRDPAVRDMASLLYVMDGKLSQAREHNPNTIVT
jgi:diguanylate cyclase (GGDEF)-like protein